MSKVVSDLTEEEWDEYGAMAIEWTNRFLPVEVQSYVISIYFH